jgi:hypothetical protein
LDEEALKIIKQLNKDYLLEQSKTIDINILSKQTEKNIYELNKKLNNAWHREVDQCYKLICAFIWFINFDYYSLLKEFNHQLIERSFSPNQRFFKIKAAKILGNLKDFLAIAEWVNSRNDWKTAFEVLNKFKPNANIQLEMWEQCLKKIKPLLSSAILEMIIQHAGDELEWENKIIIPHEKIANTFLSAVSRNAHQITQNILNSEKEANIGGITSFIFGSNKNMRGAQFYVNAWNEAHASTGIPGFKHIAAFNYCIVFIFLFFKKIKSICNTCIIHGNLQTIDNVHSLSEILYDFTTLAEQMPAYDASLSDLGERGIKLKHLTASSLSGGAERIKFSQFIESINDGIFTMIHKLIHNLGYLIIFFSKFENVNIGLEKNNSNIKALSVILTAGGHDITETKEKTAAFLKLLGYLGFEDPVHTIAGDISAGEG